MVRVDEIYNGYLTGELFSNSKTFVIEKKFPDIRRVDLIRNISKNKKVIHIGCVDHLPLINEKIKNNIWLHKIITDVSAKCIGVDINQEGILYMKNKLGYQNVIHADITKDNIPDIENDEWDYMILGEIIEHLDNPISFIHSIVEKYKNNVQKIIITAPNIMVKTRFKRIIRLNAEEINTDHRFWFTPYTLAKILTLAGLKNIYLDFADRSSLTMYELFIRKLKIILWQKNSYPFYYFNSIIAISELK